MSLNSSFDCPVWTPLHLTRTLLVRHVKQRAAEVILRMLAESGTRNIKVLDVGCGHMPYKRCFDFYPEVVYKGADIPWAGVQPDYAIDPTTGCIDAETSTFDVVVHFQTLEHVPNYKVFLDECFRVLRPGGTLICTLPFMFPYHAVPNDYRRWTIEGLAYDLSAVGFTAVTTTSVESDAVSLITILELYISECLGYVVTKPLFFAMNLIGWAFQNSRRSNYYLHSSATARKPGSLS